MEQQLIKKYEDIDNINDELKSFIINKIENIKKLQLDMTLTAIDIGKELYDVRSECENNKLNDWTIWIKEECNLSQSMVYNYINLYEKWGDSADEIKHKLGELGIMKGLIIANLPDNINVIDFLEKEFDDGRKVEELNTKDLKRLIDYINENPNEITDVLPYDIIYNISRDNVSKTPEYQKIKKELDKANKQKEELEMKVEIYNEDKKSYTDKMRELEDKINNSNDSNYIAKIEKELEQVQKKYNDLQTKETQLEKKRQENLNNVNTKIKRVVSVSYDQITVITNQVDNIIDYIINTNENIDDDIKNEVRTIVDNIESEIYKMIDKLRDLTQ